MLLGSYYSMPIFTMNISFLFWTGDLFPMFMKWNFVSFIPKFLLLLLITLLKILAYQMAPSPQIGDLCITTTVWLKKWAMFGRQYYFERDDHFLRHWRDTSVCATVIFSTSLDIIILYKFAVILFLSVTSFFISYSCRKSSLNTRNQCLNISLLCIQNGIKKCEHYFALDLFFIICLFSLAVHIITQFSTVCDLN